MRDRRATAIPITTRATSTTATTTTRTEDDELAASPSVAPLLGETVGGVAVVGCEVGAALGWVVGCEVGATLGVVVGSKVVGMAVGAAVGPSVVGASVERAVGTIVGSAVVGAAVGAAEGAALGAEVGAAVVGACVGAAVVAVVGALVGATERMQKHIKLVAVAAQPMLVVDTQGLAPVCWNPALHASPCCEHQLAQLRVPLIDVVLTAALQTLALLRPAPKHWKDTG